MHRFSFPFPLSDCVWWLWWSFVLLTRHITIPVLLVYLAPPPPITNTTTTSNTVEDEISYMRVEVEVECGDAPDMVRGESAEKQ